MGRNLWQLKVILLLAATFCFVLVAFSYKPRNIEIDADFTANKLRVKVQSQLTGSQKNYIRRIEIFVDNRKSVVKNFFFQKRGYYQTWTVEVEDLANTAKVTIAAYGEKGGVLKKTFDIQELKRQK